MVPDEALCSLWQAIDHKEMGSATSRLSLSFLCSVQFYDILLTLNENVIELMWKKRAGGSILAHYLNQEHLAYLSFCPLFSCKALLSLY